MSGRHALNEPRRRAWLSRIALRLLAFNLLLLFLPAAGIFYLDAYESRLLDAQERAMVQEGRLLAAALPADAALDGDAIAAVFGRLTQRGDARLRVYDASGHLVADSSRVRFPGEPTSAETAYASESTRDRLLYRIGALLVRVRQALWSPFTRDRAETATSAPAESSSTPPEVLAALGGRYGPATRATPGQRSLTLYSALPIRRDGAIVGAVLVSQTTFRVLQALYDVRLRIFAVVVASVGAAALITALAAATVVRPIARLRREATDLAERRSRLPGRFPDAGRRDELGDLARALEELTRRLDEHIRAVEQFASDVSHEFRNPLAAIRSAVEMAAQAERPEDRLKFLDLARGDADRLERLVSGVRELARVDTELEQEPLTFVDVGALTSSIVEGLQIAHPDLPRVHLAVEGRAGVRAAPDRLAQALENVISNARSLAPVGTTVEVSVSAGSGACRVTVDDRGPGIPDAHLHRIFDRFFSYRPADERQRHHAGLGLAIARTVIQGYRGTIAASNREGGGARFEIVLPATAAGSA